MARVGVVVYREDRESGDRQSLPVLQGGFSESLLATFNNEDELTSGYGVPLHDYGYDSDSDLEDDEDDALPPEKSVEARSEVSELHAEHNSTEAVDASSSTGVYIPSLPCTQRTDPAISRYMVGKHILCPR